MALLTIKLLGQRAGQRLRLASAFAGCLLVVGCVSLGSLLPDHKSRPPEGEVVDIAAAWENQPTFLPDRENNGKPTPCLIGRLFLMSGKHAHPIVADGDVVVQLLRADQVGPDGDLLMVEQWTIPNDKLRQMRNKDMIGWGYTLALPWATYNPAFKNFVISVCYRPIGGHAFYARSKLNIQYGERQFSSHQSVQLPTLTK